MAVPIEELRARPRSGAAFLDEKHPNWEDKIRRPIHMPKECPFTLLYGSYEAGLQRHNLDDCKAFALGFRGEAAEIGKGRGDSPSKYYATLSGAWNHQWAGLEKEDL